jgi:AcrR family transcriptional regulator
MSGPRSARGEATRASVLDAARAVLVGDGLERFVMREIAARSGITLGNLQYYFATRDDLLEAVIRAEFDRDLSTFRRTVADRSQPVEELAGISRGLVENWCTGGGSVFAALSLLAYHNERFARLGAEIYRAFYAELGHLMRRIDPGASDEELTARVLLVTSVLDGVAMQTHAAVRDEAACNHLLANATALVGAIASGATPS